ncbi:ArsR family transcriptional regulator [Actinorhabdospora filicis]|uniref:ArsR family transcriptional regulator n=1 Tax=Actinorhabdospora filicis TaxID=1785913 RepID=A0A9W6SPF8_9ACTN|nr:MarR family transcriptional regulator [Actinorhabdospora filicis]GLZ79756.1 ArsR family transcriptional regulator [Actinorhabdospora filicis]
MTPEILGLAAHPLRWTLLAALADSDRQVRELTALAGEPQNLVSYHLGKLRAGGLVRSRRSSADGRDTYYTADLGRFGALLSDAGAALHPGLALVPPVARVPEGVRVLFLCTGNSARSQLAAALLRALGVAAESAGSRPKELHPQTARVLAERGLDPARPPRPVSDVDPAAFALVVTLCDRLREECPPFPGAAHWSIADPSGAADVAAAFDACAEELAGRVGFLAHRLSAGRRVS